MANEEKWLDEKELKLNELVKFYEGKSEAIVRFLTADQTEDHKISNFIDFHEVKGAMKCSSKQNQNAKAKKKDLKRKQDRKEKMNEVKNLFSDN